MVQKKTDQENDQMNSVLFEVQHLYYLPQFIPIMDELVSRKQYNLYVSLSCSEGESGLDQIKKTLKNKPIQFIRSKTEEQRIAQCRVVAPQILFVGNIGHLKEIASPSTLIVMVYHGIGLKSSFYKDMDDDIDLYAVESMNRVENMINAGLNREKIVCCGLTKLDPLFSNSKRNFDISVWRLNPELKTVFYTPTFYPSSVEKTVDALLNHSLDFNLIVKLHQFSWQLEKYTQHQEIVQKLSQKKNVYIVPQYDIEILQYYLASDLLLTDISSTMFEYLVLNRPVVQCLDMTFRKHHELIPWLVNQRFDHERMQEVDFTYQVQNADDLIHTVQHALQNNSEMQSQRLKAIEMFHYNPDGQASKRLVDVIEAKLVKPYK